MIINDLAFSGTKILWNRVTIDCLKPFKLTVLLLIGCTQFPTSGPTSSEVIAGVKAQQNQLGVHVVPLDQRTILAVTYSQPSFISVFPELSKSTNYGDQINIGDTLQISIFEVGNALFSSNLSALSPGLAGGPSGSVGSINLPLEQVDYNGDVDIPYGGLVQAKGLTPNDLADKIAASLKGQSQNPQVLVTIVKSLANSVIISGAVHNPGRVALSLAHERILDIIAIAGGSTQDEQDVYVALTRNNRTARILMSLLEDDPSQNVYLQAGDRIALAYDPRSFTVFGAAEKVQQLVFDAQQLSLAEAVARAGGPADAQADPQGVFIFRFEDPATATRLGISSGQQSIPVIYQLDMMQPDSYFYAQRFMMRDQDLLYIANARTNRLSKLFGLVSNLLSPAATVNNFVR